MSCIFFSDFYNQTMKDNIMLIAAGDCGWWWSVIEFSHGDAEVKANARRWFHWGFILKEDPGSRWRFTVFNRSLEMQSNDRMHVGYRTVFDLKKTVIKSWWYLTLVTSITRQLSDNSVTVYTTHGCKNKLRWLKDSQQRFKIPDQYTFDFNLSKITYY